MDGRGEWNAANKPSVGVSDATLDDLVNSYGGRNSLDGYSSNMGTPRTTPRAATPLGDYNSFGGRKSVDGYSNNGETPRATPRATPGRGYGRLTAEERVKSYEASRKSVDGYSSNGATPRSTPRPTPGATPSRTFPEGEASRKSASLIMRGLSGIVGGKKSGRMSDEDELQGAAYFEEISASRPSNASPSPRGVSFLIGGPVQIPENDQALAFDVEAARRCVASTYPMDHSPDYVEVDIGKPVRDNNPPLPVHLKFEDVRYKVVLRQQAKWRGQGALEKEILHGVTGMVSPGEMLAMMGPSGSGKTTLLNLLGGRRVAHNLSGTITYNDVPFSKHLKNRMGFVTQDDILYPHLTVRETLIYAALLRLPKSCTKFEKIERAEDVIIQLGLERCRDTIIGGSFLRGVSGGERKRVCIGHEILIDPSLIFLDEPTSGLDSTTALRIIQLLQNIAQGGRTVVTTIHQPSSRVFHMFDKLILLSEGHPVYFGKAMDALNYFSSIGFSPLIAMNPADFLLDLCCGNTNDVSVPQVLEESALEKKEEAQTAQKNEVQILPAAKDVRQYLVDAYVNQLGSKVEDVPKVQEELKAGIMEKKAWTTTWWQQFCVLFIRGLKERRHDYLSSMRVLQVVSIAIFTGCLWWQSSPRDEAKLQDQVGLLFFIAMFWGYFPLFTAIFTFPLERTVLAKERASNMYRLSAYFMARTLGDLPLDLILPIVFVFIVYFMTHLAMSVTAFFLTLMVVLLTVVTSQGVGLCIGAVMMDVKRATTFASVVILALMLAGGFFVQHIPGFVKWLRYLSFQYYSYELITKVQYSADQPYNCTSDGHCQKLGSSSVFHGLSLGGGGQEAWVLILMVFGYRFLAYLALSRMTTAV